MRRREALARFDGIVTWETPAGPRSSGGRQMTLDYTLVSRFRSQQRWRGAGGRHLGGRFAEMARRGGRF